MTSKQWNEWLLARVVRNNTPPFQPGKRYRVRTAPIKNKPELTFDIVGTFDHAVTSLIFIDDDGRERRINSATITNIEELS